MLPGRWLSAVIPVDLFAMQTTVGLQLPLRWEHSTNAHVSNCGTSTSFTHVTIATWDWYEYCWSVCKMVYMCVCLRNKQSCWDQRLAVRSLKRFFYKMQTCSVVQAWSNKLICSNSDIAELLMWPGWVHPTNFPCVCVFFCSAPSPPISRHVFVSLMFTLPAAILWPSHRSEQWRLGWHMGHTHTHTIEGLITSC